MDYKSNIEALKDSMKIDGKTPKHTINKRTPFLPFKTREPERAKFKRGFLGISGEVGRLVTGKKLFKDMNLEDSIDKIISEVRCDNDEDLLYLKKLISEYLMNQDGDLNIFHAFILQYVKFTEGSEAKGEESIAKFIYDVILNRNSNLKRIFENKNSENIIIKLILEKLDTLEDRKEEKSYINNLDFISKVANEDLEFMMNHEEFFLKNFQNILAYYYFYYITQLVVKLNKKSKADYTIPEEIYYLLDSEKASNNRRSVNKGYKLIKNESRNLLLNMNLVEHLNFIFGVEGQNFRNIYEIYELMDSIEKKEVLRALNEWIDIYRECFNLNTINIEIINYEDGVKILYDSLNEQLSKKTMQGTASRYSIALETIGKKYFLKRRGVHGYMLNMTQEMLLLITAVSIKEEKITLKALFSEYERRGIFLDQYSKEVVVELLSKLNLIDKKSDSGDAQYVKAIL